MTCLFSQPYEPEQKQCQCSGSLASVRPTVFQLLLQQTPRLETAHPTPTAPSTITLLQTTHKNVSQPVNGSGDTALVQHNSTAVTVASSNGSDVSTPPTTTIITAPTQAGKEAIICSNWCHMPRQRLPISSSFRNKSCLHLLIMN